MPVFKFKAQKPGGEVYEGKRTAVDKFALYRDVKSEGDTVVFTEEIKEKHSTFFSLSLKGFMARVTLRDKILFARNLGSMLQAGLSLSRGLSIIERQTTKKGLKGVIQKVASSISQGRALSEALKEFPQVFQSFFVSMVRAGEESGSLPTALRTISDQMDRTHQLQKKIRGAMIYPAIIVVVIIAISILMLVYVVPTLTGVFSELNIELPWNTRLIIFLSRIATEHTMLLLLFFGLLIVGFSYGRKTALGQRLMHTAVLHMPVIKGITRESNSARTARTLSSLLSAGVEVVAALEITADVVQNTHFKSVLELAKERIKKGELMSSVFAQHADLYPIFVSEMISIGEETGKLGEMLSNVADYYEDEVDQKTKNLSTIIEPVLMVLIGCAVAFFALSILAPTYSLVNEL